jgi:quinol monooxygenase YgiN
MSMVKEIALITIRPDDSGRFESAVAQAAPLFRGAPGCLSMALERSVESPERYRLVVRWATLEDHTVHFRNSEAFKSWRALAGPFFTVPPVVEHVHEVGRYFQ